MTARQLPGSQGCPNEKAPGERWAPFVIGLAGGVGRRFNDPPVISAPIAEIRRSTGKLISGTV